MGPDTARQCRQHRFAAMGTTAHVVIVGGDDTLLRRAERLIRQLERRWSRFIETSELSTLNRHPGRPTVVSAETFELVATSVAAWRLTGGRFDPTVGPALAAHGYDRTFSEVVAGTGVPAPVDLGPSPGLADVDLDPELHAVTIPAGVCLDPGGIGKGLAADLTAGLLVEMGAEGALVNLGGDLRAVGTGPSSEGWVITVPDPQEQDRELLRLAMPEGAVATSSRLLRRWATSSGPAHHLIDPLTGRPAVTDSVAATVVAGQAWWAEALAKELFLRGPAALAGRDDVHAVVVTSDGRRHATPEIRVALR